MLDKRYRFTIDLGSTSFIVNKGHRLRLRVTSSNADFAIHPNVFGEGERRKARQTLRFGPGAASALILPVVDTASQQSHVWTP